MTFLFAFLLFLGVATPAAIHALWGTGSTWPEASAEALARSVVGDGRRRENVPPLQKALNKGFAQRQGAEHQGSMRDRFVARRPDPSAQSGDGMGDQLGRFGGPGQGSLRGG